jgi:hypothetical protein
MMGREKRESRDLEAAPGSILQLQRTLNCALRVRPVRARKQDNERVAGKLKSRVRAGQRQMGYTLMQSPPCLNVTSSMPVKY